MIRRFNYTKRKSIERRHTQVSLHKADDGSVHFDLVLKLDSYSFPENAEVRLEAWRSNASQRWALGTVGNLRHLAQTERVLVDVNESAQFRVAVVAADESGLLFGLSKDLRPVKTSTEGLEGHGSGSGESMLPVEVVDDLGEEVWRLDFGDGDVPVLQVNAQIEGITEIVAADPAFRSLIMPDVFRAILHRAILVDQVDPDDTEPNAWTDWIALGIRHASDAEVPVVSDTADELQRANALNWVEVVVRSFAAQNGFTAATTYAAVLSMSKT